MSSSWVAASVRAKLLSSRRLGTAGARELATSPSFAAALERLVASPYGHDVAAGMKLEEAQAAIASTLLWHIRVLAGWLPPGGGELMRSLAAWFEIANVRGRLAFFASGERQAVFELGSLATAWPALSETTSLEELHQVLKHTAWSGAGGETAGALVAGMQLRWAGRLLDAMPFASSWITAATALFLARLLFLTDEPHSAAGSTPIPGFSPGWQTARSIDELAAAAPPEAAWVLADLREPRQLWMGERRWWQRVSHDATEAIVRLANSPRTVVSAVVLLAADAWRTRAALSACAGKGRSLEVLDALA